jgi:hypothetical protein
MDRDAIMNKYLAAIVAAFVLALCSPSAFAQLAPVPPVAACTSGCPGDHDEKPQNQASKVSEAACGVKLAHLRRVTASSIKSVRDAAIIRVVPICTYKSLAGDNARAALPGGNVTGLHSAIGRNKVIAASLLKADFEADDVVGLVLAKQQVLIYVHKHD